MDTNYTKACDTTKDAIKTDGTSKAKWTSAGATCASFFKTPDAMVAVKAQFIADAVLPAMDKRHRDALAVELPRKGTKAYTDYVALNSPPRDLQKEGILYGEGKWDAANQAKKDARAIAHTYFARLLKYAFPPEDKEAATPRDLKTRINEELAALVKACQKAEGAPFDVGATIKGLESVLAIVNK